ncbi:MAG TPA: efflux RND transporter periplasmic adaptor subunit [Kofleriaceae bacterium]|nr:efflux RND transporter periplasmic adaptor subunit [Kofleriaceae bacterium]
MSERERERDPDAPEDLGFSLPPPARSSRVVVALAVTALAGGAFAIGYVRHLQARGNVPVARDGRPVRVEVVKPVRLGGERALDLPGTVRPLEETRIYPRTTGYVRRWLVDIGDKVTAGQVLAEIDTPELDAQLAQARAAVAQARAAVAQATSQRDLSKANAARFQTLSEQQLVSKAQVEQAAAQAQTDEANVAAAQSSVTGQEANLRRLGELAGFAKVAAPFAGTVTTRSIDRGSLVSEGTGTPLFTVVATDPVRIFVDVPQSIAPSVRPGIAAEVTARELGERKLAGAVARAAGALDPELHTMTTEIRVPNGDGALLPGMYVRVQLKLPVPAPAFEIPATALYSDAQGVRVGIVDAGSRLRLVPITIERDTGATLHVATGLTGDERVVKLALPGLPPGALVEVAVAVVPPPPAAAAGSAGSAGSAAGSAR